MNARSDYTAYSDIDLLNMIADDNEKAFEEIYERYWLALLNNANKRLQDKSRGMDVIQNVFIDLWDRRKQVKIEYLKAYLLQATRFQVYKYIEKSKGNSQFLELVDSVLTTSFSADSPVLDKELYQLFADWIQALPAKRNKMFLLYLNNNLSTKLIAQQLEIPRKTVQNQLGIMLKDLKIRILNSLIFILLLNQQL